MPIDPEQINTIRVGELPHAPFSITDLIPHEIGTTLFNGTIEELAQVIGGLVKNFQYEIKCLHVNDQYLIDNVESSGLGKNLLLGWAVCDGRNGTPNYDGRVPIGFGTNFSVLGITGGSPTHTITANELPPHSHPLPQAVPTSHIPTPSQLLSNASNINAGEINTTSNNITTNTPMSIMQPYIVQLFIMKL